MLCIFKALSTALHCRSTSASGALTAPMSRNINHLKLVREPVSGVYAHNYMGNCCSG